MTPQHNYKLSVVLVGFFLTLLFIWNRFIRVRLPKNLTEIPNEAITITIVIILIISFVCIIFYNMRIILKISPKANSLVKRMIYKIGDNNIVNKITTFCITYLVNSPKTFYEYIFDYINVSSIIELPVSYLLVFMLKRPHSIIYILTNTIPKVIISTIFLLDVFYFHNLHYFYISLILLGIPVIVNCYRYMVNDLADKNNFYLQSHLEITPSNRPGFSAVKFKDKIPPIEDAKDIVTHKNNKALLDWFVDNFELYCNIKNFCTRIQKAEDLYKPYENIYIYTCYLIGWVYILIIILKFL
jgi:hypothetical protein